MALPCHPHRLHVHASSGTAPFENPKTLFADDAYVVSLVAGGAAGAADGVGSEARLRRPTALAAAGGDVFVTDFSNHAVRRVHLPTGRVAWFAGEEMPFRGEGYAGAAAVGLPRGARIHRDGLTRSDTHRLEARDLEFVFNSTLAAGTGLGAN